MKFFKFLICTLLFFACSSFAEESVVGEWKLISSGGNPPPSFLKNSMLVITANKEIISVDLSEAKNGTSFATVLKNSLSKGTWKIENKHFFASNSLLKSGSLFSIENEKLVFQQDPYISDQGVYLLTVYERKK